MKKGKKTTALARRPKTRAAARKPAPVVAAVPQALPALLGDEVALGALGVVEVKLTQAEEAILGEAVNAADVLIKPTGQPYLSHPSYTKWFNRAFGRLGWAIAPCAKPRHDGKSISCPYILYIHGQPAAFAMGEQEYFENNKEQTFGDAYEATVASALRRCAKRLGVGLELWDRTWLNAYMDAHCVMVWLQPKDGQQEKKPVWRRRVDPPFWNEKKGGPRQSEPSPASLAPQVVPQTIQHADSSERITIMQRDRIVKLTQRMGRTEGDVKRWLAERYGFESTREITRDLYNVIAAAIEAPGPLV